MRAGRLVSLLLLLQTRGHMTAEQLARELEVSIRTIYRDVDALSQAGVPIYADRGPLGGIRLVDGYRTRLTGLTTQEAEALFLSGLPGPAAELGLGTVVTAARLKVLAALPPELRTRASRISQRFHLDAPGWFQTSEQLVHLETLANAVWENRRIEIDYPHEDAPVTRLLDPLGLVLKAGIWYLVASVNGATRTYRVSRVIAVRPTDAPFERPADFDLAAHWADSIMAYERQRHAYTAVFRCRPDDVESLGDVVGMRRLGESAVVPDPVDPGLVRVTLSFEWMDQAQAAAFGLGHIVEVLEPPELRAQMVKVARAVLARYVAASDPEAGVSDPELGLPVAASA
jgi:predicted DNA-binding transcriptional regulator YafY